MNQECNSSHFNFTPLLAGKIYPDGVFSLGVVPPPRKEHKVLPHRFINGTESSQNSRKYGSKGITSYGRRVVSCSALLLEQRFGKKRLGFGTATIPPITKEGLECCLKNWSEITRRFFEEIKRVFDRRGHKFLYVAVTEIQDKRFKKEGLPYPHLHWVYVAREKTNSTWYISASLLRSIWRRILVKMLGKNVFLRDPCQKCFGASIDCSAIKKSASAYIGKYMSKGSTTVDSMKAAGFEYYPKQWWSACKTVKEMFRCSVIHLDSNTCSEFFYELERYLKRKIVVWHKYLYKVIGEVDKCVGLVGRLSDWAYQELKEASFDSS